MVGQKYDRRAKNKKYTTPLPYSWDVGQQKDILRWPSQQKKTKKFTNLINIVPDTKCLYPYDKTLDNIGTYVAVVIM